MKIIFYNVEHGSCCHIITPANKHILVDVGSKSDASVVVYIKQRFFAGCDGRIDQLIITHPHEDHIYDLPRLYSDLPPRVLHRPRGAFNIVPSVRTSTHIAIADVANKMNDSYNQPIRPDEDPLRAENNGGVSFKIITPKTEWTTTKDINTFSNIVVVEYLGYKFVLTGDNPASILRKMMENNSEGIREAVKDAAILLAPHHGRANEFCREFFECVNPQITVVSDGCIEYGTQEETARLYKGRGVDFSGQDRYVLTTRNDGTISVEIQPRNCTINLDVEGY